MQTAPAWAFGRVPPAGWGASLAPLRVLADVVELRGEWRNPRQILAIILAGGGQPTSEPFAKSHLTLGGGAQAMHAVLGDARTGILLGGELRYEHKDSASTSELQAVSGTSHGAALGLFLAGRLTAAYGGLYAEAQLGARLRWISTTTTCCATLRDDATVRDLVPMAGLNVGWLW